MTEYQADALYFTERAVNAVIDYLKTALPGIVAAVNDDWGDDGLGITIEAPVEASYSVSEWNWQLLPSQRPCIAVLGDATFVVNDSPGYLQHRTPMTIIIVDEHVDKDVLRRKLYRLAQAIMRALLQGRVDGRFGVYWQTGGYVARFSPITISDGTFFTDAQIYVDIQLEETHPHG